MDVSGVWNDERGPSRGLDGLNGDGVVGLS